MAAPTITDWVETSLEAGGKRYAVHTCTVTSALNDDVAYTNKTLDTLDLSRPFTLFMESTVDPGVTSLVGMYAGYSEDFALGGAAATITVTDGTRVKDILDDATGVATTPVAIHLTPDVSITPENDIADVGAGLQNIVPPVPYVAFGMTGTNFAAHVMTYRIVQEAK